MLKIGQVQRDVHNVIDMQESRCVIQIKHYIVTYVCTPDHTTPDFTTIILSG